MTQYVFAPQAPLLSRLSAALRSSPSVACTAWGVTTPPMPAKWGLIRTESRRSFSVSLPMRLCRLPQAKR